MESSYILRPVNVSRSVLGARQFGVQAAVGLSPKYVCQG